MLDEYSYIMTYNIDNKQLILNEVVLMEIPENKANFEKEKTINVANTNEKDNVIVLNKTIEAANTNHKDNESKTTEKKESTIENASSIEKDKGLEDSKIPESKDNGANLEETATAAEKKKLAVKHQRSFAAMYDILDKEMLDLGRMQASKNEGKEWKEEWDKTFGAKETVTSVSIRLVNAFNKLAPMETKAFEAIKTAENEEAKEYAANKVSYDLYRRFVKKIRDGYEPTCEADCYKEGGPLFKVHDDDDPAFADVPLAGIEDGQKKEEKKGFY